MEFEITRLIFAFIVGYFLCLSGSLVQIVTNNSIASPSTLGMDGLAVFIVIIAQFFHFNLYHYFSFEILAFSIFYFSFTGLAFLFLRKGGKAKNIWGTTNIKKYIIIGLGFNLFVGAIFSVIQFMFMSLNYEFPTGLWFGNFKQFESFWLYIFVSLFILVLILLKPLKNDLAILNIGANFALGVGVDVKKTQKKSILISLFLTGIVICFFGVFSFLGLIFPHILRSLKLFSDNINYELTLGPLLAGLLLLLVDLFCYNLTFQGAEFPVGMASSVIGAFILIFIIFKQEA